MARFRRFNRLNSAINSLPIFDTVDMISSSFAHIFNGDNDLFREGLQLVFDLFPNGARVTSFITESGDGNVRQEVTLDGGYRFSTLRKFRKYIEDQQCDVWIYDDDRVSFSGQFNPKLKYLYMRILDPPSMALFTHNASSSHSTIYNDEDSDNKHSSKRNSDSSFSDDEPFKKK